MDTVREKESIQAIFERNLLYIKKKGKFPQQAVSAVIENREEITPYLLSLLGEAVENPQSIDDNAIGHLFALYLLSQFKEKKAFQLVIKLSKLPENDIEALIGDAITEELFKFLASTYDGNLSEIKGIIEGDTLNKWSRYAAIDSLLVLVREGELEVDEVAQYLTTLFHHPVAMTDDEIMGRIVDVCCDLNPLLFTEVINEAFDNDRMPAFQVNRDDVNQAIAMAKRQEQKHYVPDRFSCIIDAAAKMKRLQCWQR